MLDSRNYYRKIAGWVATVAMSALLVTVCLSEKYNTQSHIGVCVVLLLLCIIGLLFKTTAIQHFRPLILLSMLVYFGFITTACSCVLFFFQGFILFLMGNSAFWLSFVLIVAIMVLSVVFGAIWCGWICWLGAFQEFIYQKNKWALLKTKKAQQILLTIQVASCIALVIWILVTKRPVLCSYDPFISVFKLKIFNGVGYITVPLLLVSSLFIYRPFCRIFCPIGLMLYAVKYLPFAAQFKITACKDCGKCQTHCKLHAISGQKVEKTCNRCGECKKERCDYLVI
jgi:polyferredoxin